MSRARIAASLLYQNSCLRASIAAEFKPLHRSSNELPRFRASMAEFEDALYKAVDSNNSTLESIFGPPPTVLQSQLHFVQSLFGKHEVYDGLGSLWRHLAKDWSAEGSRQQLVLRDRIVALVRDECARPRSDADRFEILVPGCGQGRLAYAIAAALQEEDVFVTGIEKSAATLALAQHMLNPRTEPVDFHPFLDAFSNNYSAASRTVAFTAPDVPASERAALQQRDRMRLQAGDFVLARLPPRHHVVVTSFLLDCVDDLANGLRAVHSALVPGGLWVFAGPLHFYQGGTYVPKPSPSLSHVLDLAEDLGFSVDGPPDILAAPYPARPGAFLLEADWRPPLFTARKRT